MKKQEAPEFQRRLNLFDSTAIVAGSMIGSGIFIVSSDIARLTGSSGWLMTVWLITGLLTVFAALSYGELAGMFPKAGGQYVYLKEAFNPLTGFLYGWTLFMVIQTGTIAAVAMAFAKYAGVLIPGISENIVWFHTGFLKLGPVQLVAILSILLLTWINARGIQAGKHVQNAFTSGKVILLVLFIVVGLGFAADDDVIRANWATFWDAEQYQQGTWQPITGFALVAAMGMAMVGTLFSSDAWNNITFTAAEVIKPRRNIPLSLLLGTLLVTALYLLANLVYITVLPLRGIPEGVTAAERGIQFAMNDRLATAAISNVLGSYAVVVMAGFIVISTFGCNNGLILSGARVYYAMAQDGIFFRKTGRLNRQGVPAYGLLFQAVWASLLCLSGTYGQLLDYVVFAVLIFYVLTIAGIFVLRIRQPEAERPYRAFGYPVIPAMYILAALLIMGILLVYKQEYTWPGLLIVLVGIPVYYLWRKVKRTGNDNILLTLVLLGVMSGLSAQVTPIPDGEQITYIAAYNWGPVWVDAGEVTFSAEKTEYRGKPAFHLKCSGRTYKTYDLLFKVRDYYDSWIDPETFKSYEFKRQINEGGYTLFNSILFFHQPGYLLSNTKRPDKPIKTDTIRPISDLYDMLAAVYRVRSMDLQAMKENEPMQVKVVIDDSVFQIRVVKLGKEVKANRSGTKYPCIKLSATMVEGTIFKKDEEAVVWLTDDLNKIPIMVEAEILVGTVKAYLKEARGLAYPLKTTK